MAAFPRHRSARRLLTPLPARLVGLCLASRAHFPNSSDVLGVLMPHRSTTHAVTAAELSASEINRPSKVGNVDGSTKSKADPSSPDDDNVGSQRSAHELADHHDEPASATRTVFHGFVVLSRATLPTDHDDSIRIREPLPETLRAVADQCVGPPPVIMPPVHVGEPNSIVTLSTPDTLHGKSRHAANSKKMRHDSKTQSRPPRGTPGRWQGRILVAFCLVAASLVVLGLVFTGFPKRARIKSRTERGPKPITGFNGSIAPSAVQESTVITMDGVADSESLSFHLQDASNEHEGNNEHKSSTAAEVDPQWVQSSEEEATLLDEQPDAWLFQDGVGQSAEIADNRRPDSIDDIGDSAPGHAAMPNPFAATERSTGLPGISTDAATHDWVPLASLSLSETDVCVMHLLGCDRACPGGPFFSMDTANGGTALRDWECRFHERRGDATVVAQIKLEKGRLWFRWLPAASHVSPMNHLRNCVLRLAIGPSSHCIQLRHPVIVPPITLRTTEESHAGWTIPASPDPNAMQLTVQPPEELGASLPGPFFSLPINQGKQWVQRERSDEASDLIFLLQTRLRGRLELSVTPGFRIGTGMPVFRLNPAKLRDARLGVEREVRLRQSQLLSLPTNSRGKAWGPGNAKILRGQIQGQLESAWSTLRQLNGLAAEVLSLDTKAAWHFRVTYESDDAVVVLLESRSQANDVQATPESVESREK